MRHDDVTDSQPTSTPLLEQNACQANPRAIVTPQGKIGFGIVPVEQDQWLALEEVVIES